MEIDKILEKIVVERNKKGFSYENMADELGITVSGYRKIETGSTKLAVERLFKIASILDISLVKLLDLDKGDLHQYNHDNENVFQQKIEHFHQENKEAYDKLIQKQQEEIVFLRNFIEKSVNK